MAPRSKQVTPAEVLARPLRHYRFEVPSWGELHDRVVDDAAEILLGMQLVIERSPGADYVTVYAQASPESLHEFPHRWLLLASILVEPNLAGRWKEWFELAAGIVDTFPRGVRMWVITPEVFAEREARARKAQEAGGASYQLVGFESVSPAKRRSKAS